MFSQFSETPISDAGTDEVIWAKMPAFNASPAQVELLDGETPPPISYTVDTIKTTSKEYGLYAVITKKMNKKVAFNLTEKIAMNLGENMARIIDTVYQMEVVDNATNRIYASTTSGGTRAANRAAMTGITYKMFTYDIAAAVTTLRALNSPTFMGGHYVGILHPLVAHRISTDVGTGGRLAIKQYTVEGQGSIYRGEIGMIHGARIIVSSNIKTYASTTTVYPSVFLGKGAYGGTTLEALQTIVKPFGSGGTEDPLNQRMTEAVSVSFACKILQQNSIVVFESAGATP